MKVVAKGTLNLKKARSHINALVKLNVPQGVS